MTEEQQEKYIPYSEGLAAAANELRAAINGDRAFTDPAEQHECITAVLSRINANARSHAEQGCSACEVLVAALEKVLDTNNASLSLDADTWAQIAGDALSLLYCCCALAVEVHRREEAAVEARDSFETMLLRARAAMSKEKDN